MRGVIAMALDREKHMVTKAEVENSLPRFTVGNIIAKEPRAALTESGASCVASQSIIYLPDESKVSLPR